MTAKKTGKTPPTSRAAQDSPAAAPITVRATRMGIYDHTRKRAGDVFTIASLEELGSWMELVDDSAPETPAAEG
jgi:hypothetical protein